MSLTYPDWCIQETRDWLYEVLSEYYTNTLEAWRLTKDAPFPPAVPSPRTDPQEGSSSSFRHPVVRRLKPLNQAILGSIPSSDTK